MLQWPVNARSPILVGKGGETIKDLKDRHHVTINTSKKGETPPDLDERIISGLSFDCSQAQAIHFEYFGFFEANLDGYGSNKNLHRPS